MKTIIQKLKDVRDLPYHISIAGETGFNRGDKAKILTCELSWVMMQESESVYFADLRSEQKWVPSAILESEHDGDCSHMSIEFLKKNNKWIFVDPTWNMELEGSGVLISDWDGVNNTERGFNCYNTLSPKESSAYLANIDHKKDLLKNKIFYKTHNDWCDSFLK